MADIDTLQASFAGGEFAPSLHARSDLQKYGIGLKKAKNVIVHPHGPVSNRPGTHYIATVKDSTKKVRVVPFEFSTTQAYVIEFGAGYCRFYKDGGQIQISAPPAWVTTTVYVIGDFVTQAGVKYYCVVNHTAGVFATDLAAVKWIAQSIYEVPTPYTEADLENLSFTQSADTLYICHNSHPPMTLLRFAHDDWDLVAYAFAGGPFMLSNVGTTKLAASATTGAITLTSSAAVFFTSHVGSLWRLVHDIPGQNVTTAFSSTTTSSSIKCGSFWRIVTRGTWSGTAIVQKSVDGGSNWTNIRAFSASGGASDPNYNTFGEVDEPCLVRISYTHVSGAVTVDLTSDPFQQTGIVKITAYTSALSVSATVQDTVGLTSDTTDWAEGSWSTYRGWPGCCSFFQDRLCFANTPSEPQTTWMTESGIYGSYKRSDPLVDSDGISVSLASRKMNAIRSLSMLGEILALTAGSDWSIGASTEGAISPTTVRTKQHQDRGSNNVQPIVAGNRAIYVQPQGSVIRDIGFEQDSAGFNGADISILSNHFFKDHQIIGLAYQQEPDSLVWAVREDGMLLSLTYMREDDVIAWTQHETQGTVESICVIPGTEIDELWLSVKRGSSRFIEQMARRLISLDPRDQFFVDAGISLDSPKTITGATKANPVVVTAIAHGFSNGDVVSILDVAGMTDLNGRKFIVTAKTADTFQLHDEDDVAVNGTAFGTYVSGGEVRLCAAVVGGLSHLEGKTVAIIGDGSVYPPQVVTSAQITLSPTASIVHVGLGYTSSIWTLRPVIPLKSGTSRTKKITVESGVITFLNSRGGWVGSDEPDPDATTETLQEIIQRTDEPMGSPIDLKTEDHEIPIADGWDGDGSVYYEQRDPLPTTITAVATKISLGG